MYPTSSCSIRQWNRETVSSLTIKSLSSIAPMRMVVLIEQMLPTAGAVTSNQSTGAQLNRLWARSFVVDFGWRQ